MKTESYDPEDEELLASIQQNSNKDKTYSVNDVTTNSYRLPNKSLYAYA